LVLIGYWPLNETSGSTAYDHSGNENHATSNGSTVGTSGILNSNAHDFNGSNDDYTQTDNNIGIGGTEPRSLSFWAKADSLPSEVSNAQHNVNWGSASSNDAFGFYVDPSDNIHFYAHGGSPNDYNTGATLDKNWHMWTVTYDSSTVKTYIGSYPTPTSRVSRTLNTDASTPLILGSRPDITNSWYGKISEVRIYNHVLTPSEIQYLYTASQRGRQVTGSKSS
jgi:hypothetical protein